MTKKKSKPFFKMTAAERDALVKQFDREILFEETKPLSLKGKALWERAKRSKPSPKSRSAAKAVVIPVDEALLNRADKYAKRHGMTRAQVVAKGLKAVIRG
jgi:hypothetical protein